MSMILGIIAQRTRIIQQAVTPAAIFIRGLVIYTGFTLPTRSMQGWPHWINYLDPIANFGILVGYIVFFGIVYTLATQCLSLDQSKGEVLVFRRNRAAADAKRLQDEEYGTSATGAGKTALIDVLADRLTIGIMNGDILINGIPRGDTFQRQTGYVQQQDIHFETATIREALRFSAALRHPFNISGEEKYAYAEDVIKLLDMEPYTDAIIGVLSESFRTRCSRYLRYWSSSRSSFTRPCLSLSPSGSNTKHENDHPERTHSILFSLTNMVVELPWNTLASFLSFVPFCYLVGMIENVIPTDSITERDGFMFFLLWTVLVFESTFADMVIAGVETAEVGAVIGLLLFAMSFIFSGVIVPRSSLPGFWILGMYRVSPFTYIISAVLAVGVANHEVRCSTLELLHFQPPKGETCGQYIGPYNQVALGAVYNLEATLNCSFCSLANIDTFLASVDSLYVDRRRNLGLIWVYIGFNVAAALLLYWPARVSKKIDWELLLELKHRIMPKRRFRAGPQHS
ncbi:ABC-2 type transporter-domain-containing protein [Daldinia decipiens]|uniref:ABC-2 type transporter-domain-containing protein n=1 Tax=Daldinia decipiens TaxID=326647 RepID=UPI0020C27921|nr:ABC-2 type transporter-domain-containing protein [Daldinia decipiens]KAI1657702.1 ABC-2 type transporter-domain-containing protein [Daldinia decipiens]